MTRKFMIVDTVTGEGFSPDDVVFGTVQVVTTTDNGVIIKLTPITLVQQDDDKEAEQLANELDLEV